VRRHLPFIACLLLVPLAAQAEALSLLDSGWWQAQWGQWSAWQTRQPGLFLLLFVALFAVLSACTLPGCAALSLLAGTWFGAVGGTLLVGLASTLGAMLSFLAARHLMPQAWQARLHRRWGGRLQQLEALVQRRSGLWLVGLRLVPVVPFAVLNPLLGLTAMPVRHFFWPSLAGLTLGSLPYVLAGLSLMDFWRTGEFAWGAIAAAALVGLAAWAGWRLRR
jgi:uncharacterized membrane protein YdjX (TVP38/TMEM64 family)